MTQIGQNLDFHKAMAVAQINKLIGEIRLKYITDLPGQESLYTRKYEMAVDYLSQDPAPADLSDYYLIEREVGITAATAQELCQIWLNMNALWEVIAGNLEEARLSTHKAINDASTRAEVDTAKEAGLLLIEGLGY